MEASSIRSLKKTMAPDSGSEAEDTRDLQVGDRVEAKCRGWTKHYPGKIKRKNRDGTFDIVSNVLRLRQTRNMVAKLTASS